MSETPAGGDHSGERRRRRLVLAAVGVAVVVLGAVGLALFLRARRGEGIHLSGRVTTPGGRPLPGVRITLEITPAESEEESPATKLSTETDANGRFALDVAPSSPDDWLRLTAEKAGYAPAELDPVDPDAGGIALTLLPKAP